MTTTLSTPTPVRPGTAEQLARIAHFRNLDLPEVEELDTVAAFLLGDIGSIVGRRDLWDGIRDDCQRLWHLITDDWDDRDLDDLTEDDWSRHSFATRQQEDDQRHHVTVNRLISDIEGAIWRGRLAAVERARAVRRDTALMDVLGGAR